MEYNSSASGNITRVAGMDVETYKRLILASYFHRILTIAGPPLLLFGFVTNTLSFVTMMSATMRRRVTSVYLAALAVADVANLIKIIFVWLQRTMLIPFEISCSVLHLFISGSFSTSTWIIIAITTDRMIAVCYPLKARAMLSHRRAAMITALIFFFSYFIYLPTLFLVKDDSLICNDIRAAGNWYSQWGRFSTCLLSWSVLPTIILCTLNGIIAYRMKHRMLLQTEQDKERASETRWLTKMSLTVTIFYASFTIPNNIAVIVLKDFKVNIIENKTADLLCAVTMVSVLINYSANFILYCVSSASFRKTFLNLWRCRGEHGAVSSGKGSSSGREYSTRKTTSGISASSDSEGKNTRI